MNWRDPSEVVQSNSLLPSFLLFRLYCWSLSIRLLVQRESMHCCFILLHFHLCQGFRKYAIDLNSVTHSSISVCIAGVCPSGSSCVNGQCCASATAPSSSSCDDSLVVGRMHLIFDLLLIDRFQSAWRDSVLPDTRARETSAVPSKEWMMTKNNDIYHLWLFSHVDNYSRMQRYREVFPSASTKLLLIWEHPII